jgi:pimeloyl-ACP methyl ester carboxylesterase
VRLAALVLLFLSCAAVAQDYEREKRWAAEVEPNIVVGDAVPLKLASGRSFLGIFTDKPDFRPAIVLVHGAGVHPDHGVIGILRAALADEGYATLSIQMPVLRADALHDEYVPLFPEAASRIDAAAAWLKQKGYKRLVLLSHSMGSRMASAYYERALDTPFAAWVCMGITAPFGRLGNVRAPVLDIYGENDYPAVLRDEWRRKLALDAVPGSRQVRLEGADHFFTGQEKALTVRIRDFLAPIK